MTTIEPVEKDIVFYLSPKNREKARRLAKLLDVSMTVAVGSALDFMLSEAEEPLITPPIAKVESILEPIKSMPPPASPKVPVEKVEPVPTPIGPLVTGIGSERALSFLMAQRRHQPEK